MVNPDDELITAKDLMSELMSDPAYVEKMKRKEARRLQRAELALTLARPIITRLRESGYEVSTIDDLVKRFSPLASDAVIILLDELPRTPDDGIRLAIIRALAASAVPFDGRPLVECYENNRDYNLRWVILNTIALTRPHSIERWLEEAKQDPWVRQTLRELSK